MRSQRDIFKFSKWLANSHISNVIGTVNICSAIKRAFKRAWLWFAELMMLHAINVDQTLILRLRSIEVHFIWSYFVDFNRHARLSIDGENVAHVAARVIYWCKACEIIVRFFEREKRTFRRKTLVNLIKVRFMEDWRNMFRSSRAHIKFPSVVLLHTPTETRTFSGC